MLFVIGNVPGVLCTIIFALPSLGQVSSLGIRQVPDDNIETPRAFRCTPKPMHENVQLPLAMPNFMGGIKQTLMLSLSMLVIASMSSVDRLVEMVLQGIARLDMVLATVGGACLVLLHIFLDRLTQAMFECSYINNTLLCHQTDLVGFFARDYHNMETR